MLEVCGSRQINCTEQTPQTLGTVWPHAAGSVDRVTAVSARPTTPPVNAAEQPSGSSAAAGASLRSISRWRPSSVAAVALAIGLIVTAALAITSLELYDRNESRLLDIRGRELGLVLTASVPTIQTPLASAAELADVTGGDAEKLRAFLAPYVGPGREFGSVSLWPLGAPKLAPTVVVGPVPQLASQPALASAFFAIAKRTRLLNVTGLLSSANPSLGFEFSTPGAKRGFAVYAEKPLPKSRRSTLESNSAFSSLNYALYLGRSANPKEILVTSLAHLPITGRKASDVVPFGDNAFTLVVAPVGSLGGTFFEDLPVIVAILGVLIALAAAFATGRLAQRRQRAEHLAGVLDRVAAENREMYTEQRSIAQTLQHALLPDAIPEFAGLLVSARYVPAAAGIDVGGDWYDVVATDDQRALLVIGDVSGHGLRAATTMASMRHAALAYAAQDARPATVLSKLSDFVNRVEHDYFATVLCVMIDVPGHRITVSSAGHPPPLLIDGPTGQFVEIHPNVPIGVPRESPYRETSVSVPPSATLVAFTDGLVERRGELLDTGLERLRAAAVEQRLAPEDLVAKLANDLAFSDHHDDTAIVGIQWQT
jgi:serine phosphatase RsbU (regulator of sigma subunit)